MFDLDFVGVGSTEVALLGGYFRSGLKGTVTLNSVGLIPIGSNGAATPNAICGIRSNGMTGVRVSDNGVPENYLFKQGDVYAVEYVPATRQLFVAGSFDTAGDVPASNIAVFQFAQNPSCVGTAHLNRLQYAINTNNTITPNTYAGAVCVTLLGHLYMHKHSVLRNNVARHTSTCIICHKQLNVLLLRMHTGGYYDGVWSEVAGGVNGEVFTMELFGDSLYVGGSFSRVGVNQFANNIAAYVFMRVRVRVLLCVRVYTPL